MTGHWLTLLESAANHPAARLSDLTMLTAAEDRQLRDDWNHTNREIPNTTALGLIAAIPALMNRFGFAQVDILKMDIEGTEYPVIGDMKGIPIRQFLSRARTEVCR